MINFSQQLRRKAKGMQRWYRMWSSVAKGLLNKDHPLLVHIIPMRRCNLSCAYCNEYDNFSPPVPTAEMLRRVDLLAALAASVVTISGGEPLLHPDLDKIIARMRRHGIISGMITNGYLLTAHRIEQLNRAGLEYLQISIDNLQPDDISMKSMKTLDKKLQLLARHADFHVNINSVVGGGIHNPEDAVTIARRAVELGFTTTIGIIHNDNGQLRAIGEAEQKVFRQVRAMGKRSFARFIDFQDDIAYGRPHEWRCRAGARYLYICEDGLVHYCSQQRGYPAIPLEKYNVADIRREYYTTKGCAPNCTISCVQQISMVDNWRDPQTIAWSGVERVVQLQNSDDNSIEEGVSK
ncbi:MAG: radical SAM protein [Acidobacteria bacterium]|nr:radical SAM protein [Acidobacteriota bacterium]